MSSLKGKLQELEEAHKAGLIDDETLKLARETVIKSFTGQGASKAAASKPPPSSGVPPASRLPPTSQPPPSVPAPIVHSRAAPVLELSKEQQSAVVSASMIRMKDRLSKRPPSTLQIVFVIDVTGSMQPVIDGVKSNIEKIVRRTREKFRMPIELSLVRYRDECDGSDGTHVKVLEFTDAQNFLRVLGGEEASGGGDTPEDPFSALQRVLKMSWSDYGVKICVWIADAPQHGYMKDRPLKNQPTARDLMCSFSKQNIRLGFMRLPRSPSWVEETDDMLKDLRSHGQISVFDFDESDPFNTVAKALAVTSLSESSHLSEAPPPAITIAKGPLTFTRLPRHHANLWAYNRVNLESPDKAAIIDAIMANKSTDPLVHVEQDVEMSSAYFADGGFRLAHSGYVTLKTGKTKMVFKDFKDRARDNFDYHYTELRAHYACAILAFMFAHRIGINPQNFEFTQPRIAEIVDVTDGISRFYTVEDFCDGEIVKFNNNSGEVTDTEHPIMCAFTHWAFEYTRTEYTVLDLQGWIQGERVLLTDPSLTSRVASKVPTSSNWSEGGMNNFFRNHRCNEYCHRAGLKEWGID